MQQLKISQKLTCLFYGEGGRDRKFLNHLIKLKKFQFHSKNFLIITANTSGGSAKTILENCQKYIQNREFDCVICFIDLDKLKHDYPDHWKIEKLKLETLYNNIKILWQMDNLEEEIIKVLKPKKSKTKTEINSLGIKNIDKFVNSDYWKRVLKLLQNPKKPSSK